jgi:outer membrane protein assembly factor BamB
MSRSSLRPRTAAARMAAVLLLAAGGVSACAGLSTPKLPHFLGGESKPKPKLKGERIPVLSLNDKLKPSDQLKEVGFQLPPASPLADWPEPGGTPDHAVEHVQAASQFTVAWRRRFGRAPGALGHVTAQPVVADGRIYVMDGQAGVSALDFQTGRELWKINFVPRKGHDREGYGGGLAVADGRLFVTSGLRFVAAVNTADGKVIWRRDAETPVRGAPTVAAGRVYAVDATDQLLTFAAADGAPGWTYQALEEPARFLRASSPAVSGETVVAPFASGELTALQAGNGTELWSFVLSLTNRNNALSEIRDIAGRPVIYRGDVLAGSHSGVFAAIDLRTGQPRWSLPIATTTTPWPAGDAIYVTSQAGEVICISREAGQVYWIADMNAVGVDKKGRKRKAPKKRPTWSGPVLASDHLVVVSDTGELRALDPRTGKLVKSVRLKTKVGATLTPVPVDGRLYVMTDMADLVAFR